ncbi:hypothetical protein AAFX30_10785 [Vibrio chagasii]|uniref:hypothetical protein n=1 Tax=Vibrio chagasii TaxID=170679 RepID=UPI0038CD8A91
MNTINRYIDNRRAYIAKKKAQPLIGFTNARGEPASWNDIAVTFTDFDNKTANFFFCNLNKKLPRIRTPFTGEDRLAPETHELLFAYTLDVLKENNSVEHKTCKASAARRFLCTLDKDIADASLEEIQHAVDMIRSNRHITYLFSWLTQHKMLPQSSLPHINTTRETVVNKSGDDALKVEKSKLPNEKSLLALGAIFHDVIPPYQRDDKNNIEAWQPLLSSTQDQRDGLICTMTALGMASPNRIGSEQVLLTVQRIQQHTEIVNGQEKTVHYLNWRGSKGYKDYQNHINAEMVDSLGRALHYTALATEPARALARFYRQPNKPLKKILGNFKPSDENLALLKPYLTKPTNLLHLGLLLGFFDRTDKYLRVTPDTKGAVDVSLRKPSFIKPIAQIEAFDKLVFAQSNPYTRVLTGSNLISKAQLDRYTAGKRILTVAEFQNHTIEVNKSQLTGYNRGQTNSVDFENALFAYTQRQVGGHITNPFALLPVASVGHIFYDDLVKHKKNRLTLFERHGFASSFSLSPHQLRHWQNDYLAKKGLPHHLITMLSGRKSPEQTLTYIHTTDAENASVIADISYHNERESDAEEKIGLRILTMDQFNEAIDKQTPTFVHETGFCTQNLSLSPCTYMSDFETQCALCSSSCHVTHDSEAIALLQKDLKVQKSNLQRVLDSSNFTTSAWMQKWYKTHYCNTSMLKKLIDILCEDTLQPGHLVRLLTRSQTIRITNLETKTVEERKFALPDADQALQASIEANKIKSKDEATNNYLVFLNSL